IEPKFSSVSRSSLRPISRATSARLGNTPCMEKQRPSTLQTRRLLMTQPELVLSVWLCQKQHQPGRSRWNERENKGRAQSCGADSRRRSFLRAPARSTLPDQKLRRSEAWIRADGWGELRRKVSYLSRQLTYK